MQTIGERLEEARKRKGISIREAAEATKIRGDYLQKFESNQFDLNLAEIYVRGFLRGYAQFLKLPGDKIVNDFKSLGLSARPKAPNREIYGRMELSVAKSDEAERKAAEPEEPEAPEPAVAPVRRIARPFKRNSGSAMPPGPMINPNLVIKGGIVVGVIVVAVLIIWGVVSLFSGRRQADTASAASVIQPVPQNTIQLIALRPVTVQVRTAASDTDVSGELILPPVQLATGEQRSVPYDGMLYVTASERSNLQVEVNGTRFNTGASGSGSFYLKPPPSSP